MNTVDYFVPFQLTTDPFQKNNLSKSFQTIDQKQVIQRLNNLLVFNGLGVSISTVFDTESDRFFYIF